MIDYYEILSSIADGIISINKEGNITFINIMACDYTGWSKEDAINQPLNTVLNIIDPKTREREECLFTKTMRACEKTSFSACPILISKTGKERYISINIAATSNNDGDFSSAVLSFRDITHHRDIEKQLDIERHNLRTQFQYSPIPMIIVNKDMIIQDINDRYMDLFENLDIKCIGKNLEECLGCFNSFSNTEGEKKKYTKCYIEKHVIEVLNSKIPFRDIERQYLFKKNSKHVICNLRFNYLPISINGDTNVLISIDDMTEFRFMENSYKESINVLKSYKLLLDKARDIILVFKKNGDIIEANEAAMEAYGYSKEELLSLNINDIRRNEEYLKGKMLKALQGGIFFETIHYRKNNTIIPVEVNAQGASLGDVIVIVSVIRDITERKKIEDKMEKAMEDTKTAYKAKSEFLANMSHEIRTPLNGIIGMIDLTMLTELSEEQKDNLFTAKTCANSLLKIINDVLDFSKIEANKMAINNVEFSIEPLISKVIKPYYHKANVKGIDLAYQISEGLTETVIGDPNRLQQVLNNLLDNAIKFTDKGHISLVVRTISAKGKHIVLEFLVTDTGIGISKSDKEKLFQSFSQIDGSHSREHGGTGLGLVISRQLIDMMGGALKVDSEKGKGSTFAFTLKFGVGDSKSIELVDEKPIKVGKTNKDVRILLVEDDKINQVVISKMLKEMGYNYDIASSGKEALVLFECNNYDLCLMDIQMPGLDGIQTTNIIKRKLKDKEKHMPIVALTAHALFGDRERFIAAGVDEYLAKPFQMPEMFLLIERLLTDSGEKAFVDKGEFSSDISFDFQEYDIYIKRYANEIKPIINQIKQNIEELGLIIESGDMIQTDVKAYDLKSLAISISADKIKSLAFRIQLAARRGNQIEAEGLCKELGDVFKEYVINLDEMEG